MIAQNKPEKYKVRIKRQDGPSQPAYFQTFEVPYRNGQNIISVLQYIAANPTTTDGKEVSSPVWDSGCLEEVCGACSMVINGHVRQSCSTLVDEVLPDGDTITIEPMTKFPVIRDLFVNRERMFENLKKVKGWVPIDGTHDLGEGPEETQDDQEFRYALSRCMTCGCCLEACPQFEKDNEFIGPQAIAQAVYFNMHETGKHLKNDRLEALMGQGGLNDCGNAQNCVRVCPKGVPLTEAIARLGRQITIHAIQDFFTGK